MSIAITEIYVYLLVFARLVGCFVFNPLFTLRSVPRMFVMGLIFFMTIILTPVIPAVDLSGMLDLTFVLLIFKEIAIGFFLGFIYQLFQLLLYFAGDIMDMQFGLSSAKMFDPTTNIQASAMGTFLHMLFILYFFATNSHLTLINIYVKTFEVFPLTAMLDFTKLSGFAVELFITTFVLILKLVVPFIISEYIIEICMGILMKVIPQIHVFVINIQVKLLIGIGLLLLFAEPTTWFIDHYIQTMLLQMMDFVKLL